MSPTDQDSRTATSRRAFLGSSAVGLAALAGCTGRSGTGGGGTLNAFLWEGWEPVVEAFTEETGISVNQENATGTNQMFTKVQNAPENYDLVVPNSGYGVRFRDADLIQPVADDKDAFMDEVPNYGNTFDYFQQGTVAGHLSDSNGRWYGAPPRFGLYGIAYDSESIDGSQLQSSADIWDNSSMWENDVGVNIDLVHSITHAVRALGYTDMLRGEVMRVEGQAWEETRQKFLELAEYTRAQFESEAQFGRAMKQDSYNVGVGPGRNDVINLIQNGNTQFEYVNPEEGPIGWTEAMFVTKSSDMVEEAKEFMNFLLEPENGAQLATADLAPSTVEAARDEMNQEEIDLFYVPPEVVETAIQDKPFANPEKWKQLGNEFKTQLGG